MQFKNHQLVATEAVLDSKKTFYLWSVSFFTTKILKSWNVDPVLRFKFHRGQSEPELPVEV